MFEIIFNGKGNLSDFGAFLAEFNPQPPAPKIIKQDVPFMNGSYDFSTVATNGELVYSERKIPCSLDFFADNKAELMAKYSELLTWLLSGQHELIYTGELNLKYMAQVEEAPSFSLIDSNNGNISFSFTAEPFKYGVSEEGSEELWDPFNFITDYLQETSFDVSGSKTIQIYNVGRTLNPIVNCNNSMTCLLNGYTANFIAGDNVDYSFRLKNGINDIVINGTGHIEFKFRKELL